MSSLFEPAGQRKRPNVLEVLEAFDDSRFILIGDSGEQDLEVYTGIAHERPHQVAAIFIRDVTTRRADELRRVAAAAAAAGEFDDAPTPSSMSTRSGRSSPTPTSGISRTSTSDDLAQSAADLQQLSAAQAKVLRRAADWDARVARAHAETPSGVRLVFFEHVDEIRDLACALVAQEVERDVHPLPKHQHRFSYGTGAKTAEPEDAPDLIQF